MSHDNSDFMQSRAEAALGDEQQDGKRLEAEIEADRVRRGLNSLADLLIGFSPSPLVGKKRLDCSWEEL